MRRVNLVVSTTIIICVSPVIGDQVGVDPCIRDGIFCKLALFLHDPMGKSLHQLVDEWPSDGIAVLGLLSPNTVMHITWIGVKRCLTTYRQPCSGSDPVMSPLTS